MMLILSELPLCLDYLEKEVKKFEWLAGNQFSIADIALITHFIALNQSGFYCGSTKMEKFKTIYRKSISLSFC